MSILTAEKYLNMLKSASYALHNEIEKLNRLNVFPIPDGDTGINMYSSFEPLTKLNNNYSHLGELMDISSHEILKSSRGNSGTILATFFYGVANAMTDKKTCSVVDLINAFKKGTESCYKTIGNPKEGTILTLMKKCSEIDPPSSFNELFIKMNNTCEEWLQKTPDLLPVLKEAGVVDSGAYGFTIIISAMKSSLLGEDIKDKDYSSLEVNFNSYDEEDLNYPYCCEGIIEKFNEYIGDFKCNKLKEQLSSLGESEVFIETNKLIKFHIHVNDTNEVNNLCKQYGNLIKFKVDDMSNQLKDIKVEYLDSVIVPICNGEGLINVYKEIGVNNIVDAGKFMNVSNKEILNVISKIRAKTIFLLSNNRNNIATCNLIAKDYKNSNILVIPTKNAVEGIIASLKFKENYSPDKNKIRMINSLTKANIYSISKAIRDSRIGRMVINKDEYVVIKNDEIIYSFKKEIDAINKVVKILRSKQMISFYYGEGIDENYINEIAEEINASFKYEKDIFVIKGDQPVYRYFIVGE